MDRCCSRPCAQSVRGLTRVHVQIEPIDEQNIDAACVLFQELHGLGSQRYIPFDDKYVHDVTRFHMHDALWWGQMARAVDGPEYVGVLVGSIMMPLFAPVKLGHEHAVYVREGVRFRGAIAMKLVKSFMAWCYDVHDCVYVETGDIALINSAAYHALYTRMGFKYFGSSYKHERGR